MYTFSVPKITEVEESTPSKNEAGEDISIVKKVSKEAPQTFALAKPTRKNIERGQFFYNKTVGNAIREGLMPHALLFKRLNNDGGTYSESDKEIWATKLNEKIKKEEEFKLLSIKSKEERSEEENKNYDSLLQDITIIERELRQIEFAENALLGVTAESHARTKTIMWWLMTLLNKQSGPESWETVLKGEDETQRENSWDEYFDEDSHTEEERLFWGNVFGRASHAITLWYYNRASEQKEFDEIIKQTT